MSQNALQKVDLCIIGTDPSGLSLAQVYALLGFKVCLVTQNENPVFDENFYRFAFLKEVFAGNNLEKVQNTLENLKKTPFFGKTITSLQAVGVETLQNKGSFADKNTFLIEKEAISIQAKTFVLALAQNIPQPDITGLQDSSVWSVEDCITCKKLPQNILVYGGNAHALSMAQALALLGCSVTILCENTFLEQEDKEVSRFYRSQLAKHNITLHENAVITSVEESTAYTDTLSLPFDKIVFASPPHIQHANMGLSKAGVHYTPWQIETDKTLKTTNPRIYALGSAASGFCFSETGDIHTGFFIKKTLFKIPFLSKPEPMSHTYFASPMLFKFGLSESDALKAYGAQKIHVYRLSYCDGTLPATDEQQGFIKIIASPQDKVLGGVIVGENAAYIAQSWFLACRKGLKVKDVASLAQSSFLYTELNKKLAANSLLPKLLSDRTKKIVRFLNRLG